MGTLDQEVKKYVKFESDFDNKIWIYEIYMHVKMGYKMFDLFLVYIIDI